MGSLHWPAGGLDLGVGGISYVELVQEITHPSPDVNRNAPTIILITTPPLVIWDRNTGKPHMTQPLPDTWMLVKPNFFIFPSFFVIFLHFFVFFFIFHFFIFSFFHFFNFFFFFFFIFSNFHFSSFSFIVFFLSLSLSFFFHFLLGLNFVTISLDSLFLLLCFPSDKMCLSTNA